MEKQSNLANDISLEQKKLGRFSYINYYFYARTWLLGNTALLLVVGYDFYRHAKIPLYFSALQIVGFFILGVISSSLIVSNNLRKSLIIDVFNSMIMSQEKMSDFIENFFKYKRMRGTFTKEEIEEIFQKYKLLFDNSKDSYGDIITTEKNEFFAKRIPKYGKFMHWYLNENKKQK